LIRQRFLLCPSPLPRRPQSPRVSKLFSGRYSSNPLKIFPIWAFVNSFSPSFLAFPFKIVGHFSLPKPVRELLMQAIRETVLTLFSFLPHTRLVVIHLLLNPVPLYLSPVKWGKLFAPPSEIKIILSLVSTSCFVLSHSIRYQLISWRLLSLCPLPWLDAPMLS